jgi:hypothetical protein
VDDEWMMSGCRVGEEWSETLNTCSTHPAALHSQEASVADASVGIQVREIIPHLLDNMAEDDWDDFTLIDDLPAIDPVLQAPLLQTVYHHE